MMYITHAELVFFLAFFKLDVCII